MTVEARPLLAGDPARVGSYRVTGRLGEGGQGVVYLGESDSGERVAIKLLAHALDEEARADFAREIELARRVRAFCTASVLSSGELDGVPYVISEYVDGPSLARVLAERGPLGGAELRRLAIGSVTALAAIHQAGVVHRDFKPGNVLLGRDGPRVIDFGISRALDAAEPDGEHLTGTPPYMAPEQFGRGAGAPADLFAWAATVVCAATGSPPFGSGDVPALVNRILRSEPELGGLGGDLREVVSSCLAKDPSARPMARAALLRLLGHPVNPRRLLAEGTRTAAAAPPLTDSAQRDATAPPLAGYSRSDAPAPPNAGSPRSDAPAPPNIGSPRSDAAAPPPAGSPRGDTAAPPHRGDAAAPPLAGSSRGDAVGPAIAGGGRGGSRSSLRRRWWLIVAGAVVVVLVGAVAGVLFGGRGTPEGSARPTAQRISPGPMNTGSTTTTPLPGTGFELYENPADPVWASSYYGGFAESDFPAYVRDPRTGEFRRFGSFQIPVASPGGRYVAAIPLASVNSTDYSTLRLADRTTGEDLELRLAEKPGIGVDPRWSADGARLLLSLREEQSTLGFVIVDAVTRDVRAVRTGFGGAAGYAWGPDASTLVTEGADGVIRYVGLDGRVLRTFTGKGPLLSVGVADTEAGTVFATTCREREVCLWDAGTGARKAVIPLAAGTVFNGWLDRRHFLATVTGGEKGRLVLAGLDGATVRVLAEGPADRLADVTVWFTRR